MEVNPKIVHQDSDTAHKKRVLAYKFDIFKGVKDLDGRILRLRSAGQAIVTDGQKTYTIHLKTLLHDRFYLLPDTRRSSSGSDFVILTREPCLSLGKKYFWNNVGDAKVLTGVNAGLMQLKWDLFGGDDLYLSLYPIHSPAANRDVVGERAA